jgi:heterodisulfide reductase subunit C
MIRPEAFPDWGPSARETAENLELWRRAMPPETMHTTSTSWEVDEKTLTELYVIWHLTGTLDMIKTLDASLHMILVDVMEEKLEEAGYAIS